MTIRSKVQSSATTHGVWPEELAVLATARFFELAGDDDAITAEDARNLYAQVLWEFIEDGKLTVGDVCFVAGHFAAEGAMSDDTTYEDVLVQVMLNSEVEA